MKPAPVIEEQPKKGRGLRARAAVNNEPAPDAEPKYSGPWYRVEANALYSPRYKGHVELGTYTEKERKKGVVDRRVAQLTAEGYINIQVIEVLAE